MRGLKEKLNCKDLGWFLDRFSFIYRDAGLIPDSIFRLEATGKGLPAGGACLESAAPSAVLGRWNFLISTGKLNTT